MANTDKIVGGVNITELANKLRSGETTIAQASSTSAVDKNIVPTNTQSVSTANTNNVIVDGLDITDLANRLRSGETTIKSTAQINNTPTIAPNATSTTYPKVDVTSADSINALNVAEQERINTEKLAAQTALSNSGLTGTGSTLKEQLFTGYETNAPVADYKTALTTAQNEYGLTEGLSEYKLQSEKVSTAKAAIENLDLQRQNELDIASNRQASMTSIAAEKSAINETYDSQRVQLVGDYNIEAAVLSAQAGYLSEANNLVDNAVQAYTADITAEIKRFDNMYSLASDWVSSLESDEKALLEDAKAELETKKEEETTRLNSVLSLKVEYPSAGIKATDTLEQATQKSENQKNKETIQGLMLEYNQYGAGVTINDSYEEALKKIQPYYNEANRTTQVVGSAETGYSLIDVKTGEVIKDIKSAIQGDGNTTEPMSVWEIQQYKKLYGWTPPSGFTRQQIDDYVNLNPNLTPSELDAGAKQALLGITNDSGESINLTSDYFKSLYTSDELYKIAEKNNLVNYWSPFSGDDVKRLLNSIDETITQYKNEGYSDQEILEEIFNNVINK